MLCLPILALTGCGSDEEGKPIPRSSVDRFNTRLDEISSRFEAGGGACNDLEKSRRDVDNELERLPEDVDQDVRQALEESFDHLFERAIADCDDEVEAPEPAPPIQQPTAPPPTQTEETPPETQTQPQEQPEQPEEDKPGKDKDKNDGGGGGDRGPNDFLPPGVGED